MSITCLDIRCALNILEQNQTEQGFDTYTYESDFPLPHAASERIHAHIRVWDPLT
jgi:hypothetical protein